MKDSMSLLSGVAASYQSMPLSMLHQLKSVLDIEISNRLESFGVKSMPNFCDNVAGGVADVESENVAGKVGNNVIIGNFKRGNKS